MAEKDAASKFLAGLTKRFGDDILKTPKLEVIPSTSLGLNILTQIGGTPRGRIMEFFGPEHGGKTTIALDYIANANKAGIRCMYIDLENALDPKWAKKLGVNFELTDYIRVSSGEQAFDIMTEAIKSSLYGLIVFDSVAALAAEAELNADSISDTKDRVGGFIAKLMSAGLRKINGLNGPDNNTGIIFINQVRDKIGVMYGDPEDTPGGRALKFYASVRIRVSKITKKDTIKNVGDIQVGHRVRLAIKKNKLGAPDSRQAEFDLYYEKGIDQTEEILDWGHSLDIFKKRGETITYNDGKISETDFRNMLITNQAFHDEIVAKIMAKAHTPLTETEVATDEEKQEKEELF